MILKVLILPIYCRKMTTPEDKRIKKILKDFFKFHKQFKEVPITSKFDAILVFDKKDLKSYHIVVCNDRKNALPPFDPDETSKIVYLKNCNPHDSGKTTRGFYIRRRPQKATLRNYTK